MDQGCQVIGPGGTATAADGAPVLPQMYPGNICILCSFVKYWDAIVWCTYVVDDQHWTVLSVLLRQAWSQHIVSTVHAGRCHRRNGYHVNTDLLPYTPLIWLPFWWMCAAIVTVAIDGRVTGTSCCNRLQQPCPTHQNHRTHASKDFNNKNRLHSSASDATL